MPESIINKSKINTPLVKQRAPKRLSISVDNYLCKFDHRKSLRENDRLRNSIM